MSPARRLFLLLAGAAAGATLCASAYAASIESGGAPGGAPGSAPGSAPNNSPAGAPGSASGDAPAADARAAAAAPTPAPYVDREIDPARLGPAGTSGGATPRDASGWPRTLRIEAHGTRLTQGDLRRVESALLVTGRIDTPDLGAFGIDATARAQPTRGSLFTLSQRGLPLEGGWRVNSSLGMLGSPVIDLLRSQTRLFLPGFALRGVATEWLREDLQWNASSGEPGHFESLVAPGFRPQGGRLQTAGLQWTPAPNWQGGLQWAEARGASQTADPSTTSALASARSALATLAWRDTGTRLQANLLSSRAQDITASGLWADGLWQDTNRWHSFGGFRLEPGLAWGTQAISNNLQGLHYRTSQHRPRWFWDAGAETVRPVTGPGGTTRQVNGSTRYRIDSQHDAGTGLTLRQRSAGTAWSWFGYGERQNAMGNTRLQADAWSEGLRTTRQVRLDHAWTLTGGARLAASLGAGTERNGLDPGDAGGAVSGSGTAGTVATTSTAHVLSAALYGGLDLSERTRVDGNLRLRAERARGGDAATAGPEPAPSERRRTTLNLSLGLVRQFDRQWSLTTAYYETRDWEERATGLTPLLPNPAALVPPPTRALFVTLRFEEQAGTPVAPLGGKVGEGAGSVAGVLFLDANDNGRHDADEGLAANVTVLLDNRFTTRTDAQGRFEFALVAAGRHSITVVPDNLPLPWTLGPVVRHDVAVRVRQVTTLAIPAVRIR